MSDKSAIEWTDATWTVVTGCSKVSPGCAHCYAETLTERFAGSRNTGWPGRFLPWTPDNAAENVVLHPERMEWPLRWKSPRRIFVTSMGDLFHELVPDEFIDRVFAVMALSPQHTYQVLTKRPQRMRDYINASWGGTFEPPEERADIVNHAARELMFERQNAAGRTRVADELALGDFRWPLPNVWLGTSVENQRWAEERIPFLLETPAAVRFLSCEPLLGPVRLRLLGRVGAAIDALTGDVSRNGEIYASAPGSIGWVIVGGESGPEARPMHSDWVRDLRDQSRATGVPFFFKQWGAWQRGSDFRDDAMVMARDGRLVEPEAVQRTFSSADPWTLGLEYVRRVGKAQAGRELDGRTWDEMPAMAVAA